MSVFMSNMVRNAIISPRIALVEFNEVVKNPLSPIEHPGGVGVNCELFELGVEKFVVSLASEVFRRP